MRIETVEEERDRYREALETLQKLDEKEDLDVWIDNQTPLGLFISMNLNLISYKDKQDKDVMTEYGVSLGMLR